MENIVDFEWVEEERGKKNPLYQSFKAISASYTARNSVAVLIPKYFILARLTGVCLSMLDAPKRSAICYYQWAERGEAFTSQATAGARCNAAIQAEKPGNRWERREGRGDGARANSPVSAVTTRCPARLNSQLKNNIIHLRWVTWQHRLSKRRQRGL